MEPQRFHRTSHANLRRVSTGCILLCLVCDNPSNDLLQDLLNRCLGQLWGLSASAVMHALTFLMFETKFCTTGANCQLESAAYLSIASSCIFLFCGVFICCIPKSEPYMCRKKENDDDSSHKKKDDDSDQQPNALGAKDANNHQLPPDVEANNHLTPAVTE